MFEEYTKGLNKTENKQFQCVLELYPKLRPRYYQEVKAKIAEDKKISPKTQEKMLEFKITSLNLSLHHQALSKKLEGLQLEMKFLRTMKMKQKSSLSLS